MEHEYSPKLPVFLSDGALYRNLVTFNILGTEMYSI